MRTKKAFFHWVSGDSLWVSKKFRYQEIGWNHGILGSVTFAKCNIYGSFICNRITYYFMENLVRI